MPKAEVASDRTQMSVRMHLKLPFMGQLNSRGDIPIDELRSWRIQTLAALKRLEETTSTEKRQFSETEADAFDEGLRLVDFWAKEISKLEQSGQTVRRGGPAVGGRRSSDTATPKKPGELVFTNSKGEEVRALRRDESIASAAHKEQGSEELSIGRLVRAVVTNNWRGAEAEQRAMGGSTATLGGYAIPSPMGARIIDLARNAARVFEAGALTVPMDSSSLRLGKLTGDPTASWKVENAAASFSDPLLGGIELNAKTLVALVSMSVELVEDAGNLESLVENSMSEAVALALDLASLRGDGTAASPVGIRNTAGIQSIDLGTNGAQLTNYSNFSTACEKIFTKNGTPKSVIYAPRTAGTIDRFVDTTNQPLVPPPSFQALQKLITNQIPITSTKGSSNVSSEAYVADFSQLLIGMRTDLVLEITRAAGDSSGSAFRNLQVWLRAYLRADCVLARPEHFVLIDGIIP